MEVNKLSGVGLWVLGVSEWSLVLLLLCLSVVHLRTARSPYYTPGFGLMGVWGVLMR